MRFKRKHQFGNHLAFARYRRSLTRKTVASLLGHKTTDAISRYECGEVVPSLATAMKLALIYNVPITVLLNEYFETCRQKVLERQAQVGGRTLIASNDEGDFCSVEEGLRSPDPNKVDLERAATHIRRISHFFSERTRESSGS
ncbi:MAG: helix-turn-helix transcriptional regulator [Pyrinomonadaceae bacterium]